MSENREVEVGFLVSSRAGRDRGRYYLVYEKLSDRFVRVVDGSIRRLENPKTKNVKHLWIHARRVGEITEKLLRAERITNAEIRQALHNWETAEKLRLEE